MWAADKELQASSKIYKTKKVRKLEIVYKLEELEAIAERINSETKDYSIFTFSGELGAGKTTFISAFCKVIGVKETVSSPTYSLIQQYLTFTGENIFHIDLYRINDEEEARNAGIEDCLLSGDRCFVEWPEKVPTLFSGDEVRLSFEQINTDMRKIIIQIPS